MVTSAKTFSAPVGPGVGKAFEPDADGSCVGVVEADPTGADAPAEGTGADDGGLALCEDASPDDPAAGGALTELVTGADGPPECDAMQAVHARAKAATAQPLARATGRKALKVSIGQILARADHREDCSGVRPMCQDCEHLGKSVYLASLCDITRGNSPATDRCAVR
jgi:hypothetical protein